MFCPSCSQEQISEATRFCSRCGFPLGLVSELISQGGFLPQLADLPTKKKFLTRNNGLKVSLIWFILFAVLCPALAGLGEENLAAFFAILGSLGGILLVTTSYLFLPKEPQLNKTENVLHQPNQPAQFTDITYQQNALPPQIDQPAESYFPPAGSWRAPSTRNLVQPGSVTDATTKLFKRDE